MNGYWNWLVYPPPFGVLIELNREYWGETWVTRREDMHPGMNVWGLYWRFTGIAQQQLESRRNT